MGTIYHVIKYSVKPCRKMLSRDHWLMYAYLEGSSWKNWVEECIDVGTSRMLEKVVVEACLATFVGYVDDDAG